MSYRQFENICRYDVMVTYDKWILSLFFCLSAPACFFLSQTAQQIRWRPPQYWTSNNITNMKVFPLSFPLYFSGLSTTHRYWLKGIINQMYILQHSRTATAKTLVCKPLLTCDVMCHIRLNKGVLSCENSCKGYFEAKSVILQGLFVFLDALASLESTVVGEWVSE